MRNNLLAIVFTLSPLVSATVLGQFERLPPAGQYEVPPPQAVTLPADGAFASQAGPPITPEAVPAVPEVVAEEPMIGPAWYNPAGWIGPYWDGSVEFGLSGSSGNADTNSLRTGFDLKRETQRTEWAIDLVYAKNESNNVETQHNALFRSTWDFKFANPHWTAYSKLGLEYDEFRDFDLRLALNGGLGRYFIKTPNTEIRGRFGAGTSREFGSADDKWKPEANLGADFERKISDRQTLSFVTDYYPAWDNFSDYRLVSDASWELVLDTKNNLSLKVSVIDRYDSTPGTAKSNDIDYAVLLLWSL